MNTTPTTEYHKFLLTLTDLEYNDSTHEEYTTTEDNVKYHVALVPQYSITFYLPNTNIISRKNKPAVLYANGDLDYIVNNQYHRTDGPAIIYHSPKQPNSYYYLDEEVPVRTLTEFTKYVKLLSIS